MCRKLILLVLAVGLVAGAASVTAAPIITAIADRNRDGDAPEDPAIGPNPLGEDQLAFVDRTHQYNVIPAHMIGAEYVRLCNDNKDAASYQLDVTISEN